jgi:hypothetical protein
MSIIYTREIDESKLVVSQTLDDLYVHCTTLYNVHCTMTEEYHIIILYILSFGMALVANIKSPMHKKLPDIRR